MKGFNLFVLVALACFCSIAFAQEGQMPSEEEMMKRWMEVASPKAEHEMLAKTAGEWDCVTKFWMAPDAPAQEGKGSCKCAVVNGGRAVSDLFKGDMMGMPFEGAGMTGYDNFNKAY